MKKIIFLLLIGAAIMIYLNFDAIVERVNNFENSTVNITVENSSLASNGALEFDVKLENVGNSPISVGNLDIAYILILDGTDYTRTHREIKVRKTIDKKDELLIRVMLPDYTNPSVDPEASVWIRNKKKSFGVKISVIDYFGQTVTSTEIKTIPSI